MSEYLLSAMAVILAFVFWFVALEAWCWFKRWRVRHDVATGGFTYADPARVHRETQREVGRLADRLSAPESQLPTARPEARRRVGDRSEAAGDRVGPRRLTRRRVNEDTCYGQHVSLVKGRWTV